MPWATALACRDPKVHGDIPLLMCSQTALRFYDDIACDEQYDGLVTGVAEGERLHELMGEKHVMFLRNHGVIVSGNSVAEAYFRLYYLEKAAEIQIKSQMGGHHVSIISHEACVRFKEADLRSGGNSNGTGKSLHGETQPRHGPIRMFKALIRDLRRGPDKDFDAL